MSLFSALNTANSALSAAQRAMDVTGQNVANVNTDGYSRQRVELQSIGGTTTPAIWAVTNEVGSGVDSDKVIRIRDAFLEARAQNKHSDVGSLTVQDTALTQVQQAFQEPGDNGIQAMMTNMWAGWGDVAKAATDPGARAQLLQRSQTLVAGLHSTMGSLDQQWAGSHDSVQTLLTDVNSTAQSIADLNQSILRADQANLPSNELQDKRDALVLHLSDQIGATATRMDDGTLNVVVGGSAIVSGSNAIKLALAGANSATDATTDPPTIVTVPGNAAVRAGGTAAGHLATMSSIIPTYQSQLNGIAQQLADQVNAVHEKGYDLNGDPGTAMFDNGSGVTTGITAANISLAITDPKKVAAAVLSPTDTGGPISADHDIATKLYQLRLGLPQADGSYADGSDSIYRKMIVSLGVQSSSTANNLTTANVISTNVDASRESVSGVNLDEEMSNMLQFQHGYAAAGKVVATIQTMMDTLINMVQG
ncbi:MAG: flgK [Frankiales bacterium]|nr:flgK [Frankiales bacterium]